LLSLKLAASIESSQRQLVDRLLQAGPLQDELRARLRAALPTWRLSDRLHQALAIEAVLSTDGAARGARMRSEPVFLLFADGIAAATMCHLRAWIAPQDSCGNAIDWLFEGLAPGFPAESLERLRATVARRAELVARLEG
jgi:hypothetical protein